MLGTVIKQPTDQLDYDIDFSRWLPFDDTILTVQHQVTPENEGSNNEWLAVQSVHVSGDIVKVWLVGGKTSETYKVTVIAATANGRVKEVEFKVRVKDC